MEWIRSFEPNSYFLDVGANIGQYSIYAAARGHKVYAVEPHIITAGALIQNVELNNLPITIITSSAYSCNRAVNFNYSSLVSGSSGSQVNDETRKNPHPIKERKWTLSIDFMIDNDMIESPNYCKIDVDGREKDIIDGSSSLLEGMNPPISILVEYNPGGEWITEYLTSLGYKVEIQHTASSKEKTDNGAYLEETPHNRLYKRAK